MYQQMVFPKNGNYFVEKSYQNVINFLVQKKLQGYYYYYYYYYYFIYYFILY